MAAAVFAILVPFAGAHATARAARAAGPVARVAAPTRDEVADRVAAFAKAFKSTPKKPRSADERRSAIAGLHGLDAPPVVKALVDAHAELEDDLAAVEERKRAVDEQIVTLLRSQEFAPKRTLAPAAKQTYEQLRTESRALDLELDGMRDVAAALEKALRKLTGDESVDWMIANLVGARKPALALRFAAASVAGRRGDATAPALAKLLSKAASAEEAVAAIEAVARNGASSRACAPALLKWLEHEDPAVREQAAAALASIVAPEGIEPLIRRLGIEPACTRRRIAIALEELTRENLGESAGAWKEWFARAGADCLSGKRRLGGGTSALAASTAPPAGAEAGAAFFGIPLEGRAFVFVVDCSGTMVLSTRKPERDGNKPIDAGPESRMEAVKQALSEALGKLSKDQRFGLIAFNELHYLYSPELLSASAAELRRTRAWIGALAGTSSRNTHDALRAAFRLAGGGPRDRYYRSAVDAVLLVTDGGPTRIDASADSIDRVLGAVRSMNPARHVAVHAIAIGREFPGTFLKQLAQENGGCFVQR